MKLPPSRPAPAELPLDRLIGPHAALKLKLLEDHQTPGNRIYAFGDVDGRREVGFTGEELEDLCAAWAEEKERRFFLGGVTLD